MKTGIRTYGVVQDDGTVTTYRTQRAAERAGALEALVVRDEERQVWVYPATGRDLDPEDVRGLSPGTASKRVRAALARARLTKGLADNGVVSDNVAGRTQVASRVQMQKSVARPDWRDRAEEVLAELPGVVRVQIERDDPMYNYWFLTVIWRKIT